MQIFIYTLTLRALFFKIRARTIPEQFNNKIINVFADSRMLRYILINGTLHFTENAE
jgi:hypothetical protein